VGDHPGDLCLNVDYPSRDRQGLANIVGAVVGHRRRRKIDGSKPTRVRVMMTCKVVSSGPRIPFIRSKQLYDHTFTGVIRCSDRISASTMRIGLLGEAAALTRDGKTPEDAYRLVGREKAFRRRPTETRRTGAKRNNGREEAYEYEEEAAEGEERRRKQQEEDDWDDDEELRSGPVGVP
jgi:hypothetical protein